MIAQTLGHFRILEKIGAGGMGEVYRAHDEQLDRDVAIKVLPAGALADETARKRFRQEALALSRLNHPNIGTVHEFGTEREINYLVMEYVAGTTLGDKLGGSPLPEKEILSLGMQLAEGLAAAQEQGVVHRDLKPTNLRVTPDGRLKILDFGLAKLLAADAEATAAEALTRPHAVPGTLPYMAPEQVSGEPADPRSDLYAAGIILYEMATGQRMFIRDSEPVRLVHAILYEKAKPPSTLNPHVSSGLENIILKCLEKNPEHRYQTARELLADLRRLGAGATVEAALPRRAFFRPWLLGVVALGIALAILFAFMPGGWRERLTGNRGTVIRSLAVLPLENLSGDPEQNYFADGITQELITDLSQV
ncbi:MAG TPA: serine/threonine-protein kinase, partial [Candidatus Acidoferrales bacterium]|nr:serine/threonine-protein kinase [Candidatus Acidoferrales bacterium]